MSSIFVVDKHGVIEEVSLTEWVLFWRGDGLITEGEAWPVMTKYQKALKAEWEEKFDKVENIYPYASETRPYIGYHMTCVAEVRDEEEGCVFEFVVRPNGTYYLV